MEPIIQVEHLKKSFGKLEVLHDIDFSVFKGEVVTIIGSSGSGKSTFLRCLNLLEMPDSGSVKYHGQDILKAKLTSMSIVVKLEWYSKTSICSIIKPY